MESPRVVLMQPTFLPWQGFFGLARRADILVFLDDFQYSRQSWQQRNRIFVGPDRADWITIPVDRHAGATEWPTLLEARPLLEIFPKRFLRTVKQTYARAPFLETVAPMLDAWMGIEHASLAALNIDFATRVMALLGIAPDIRRSSQVGFDGKRSQAVADLLRRTGARTYLAARGSFAYMKEDGIFPVAGVETVFQRFEPQPYAQRQSRTFVPYLSVLDALLQVGPDATRALVDAGEKPFDSWKTMVAGAAPAPAAEPDEP